MLNSFRGNLLLVVVGVLGVALAAAVVAVWHATDTFVANSARQQLNIAGRVFQSELDTNAKRLRGRVELLVSNTGFKWAVVRSNEQALLTALAEHGEAINADIAFLLDAKGKVLYSTYEQIEPRDAMVAMVQDGGGGARLVLAYDEVLQVVVAPIGDPNVTAWVGMGFVVDNAAMTQFKNTTGADISLIYRHDDSVPFNVRTTLEEPVQVNLNRAAAFPQALAMFEENLARRDWLSQSQAFLHGDGGRLAAVFSTSLREALAANIAARNQLAVFAVIILAGVALAVMVMAQQLIRPLESLTAALERMGRGDYGKRIETKHGAEFNRLAVALNTMQHAIAQREKEVTYRAQHDLLTGVPNRNYIADWLRQRLEQNGEAEPFCLAVLHIDRLHELVDVYGSEVGDDLIKLVATRVQGVLKSGDIIARLDGGDFLLFFDATSSGNIASFGLRILDLLSEPFRVGSIEIKTGARLGFAVYPEHGRDHDALIRRAYVALSRAQDQRTDLAVYQIGQDEVHRRQIRITNRLQQAIKHNTFQLRYQPQYDFRQQRVTQVEAVIRWDDEELGPVNPDEFIPLAEHSGDISRITEWIFAEAVRQLADWAERDLDLALSINLSARDILRREFIQHMIDTVTQRGIDKSKLVLEVTESAMVEDPNRAIGNLRKLHEAGLKVAMDDFGTGYSSLSQLKVLPIDELKIDKSFIQRLDKDEKDQKIVRATIDMAHSLHLAVVAEGAESIAVLSLLEASGCDRVQGFCLSQPLPEEELVQWLRESEEEFVVRSS